MDADGEEHAWDIDKLRDLAIQLTVDENGHVAGSDDFDPDNIVQWGYGNQYADVRGCDTMWTQIGNAVTVIGTLTASSLVAYGFARFRFPLKNLLFVVLISTNILPQPSHWFRHTPFS